MVRYEDMLSTDMVQRHIINRNFTQNSEELRKGDVGAHLGERCITRAQKMDYVRFEVPDNWGGLYSWLLRNASQLDSMGEELRKGDVGAHLGERCIVRAQKTDLFYLRILSILGDI